MFVKIIQKNIYLNINLVSLGFLYMLIVINEKASCTNIVKLLFSKVGVINEGNKTVDDWEFGYIILLVTKITNNNFK